MNLLGVGIYVKNSPKAVEMYQSAFGLELGYHVLNDDNTYYHSELMKDGHEFCSVVEAGEEKSTEKNPIQLCYTFETRDEFDHAFSVLKDGGIVEMDICELPWSPCAAVVTDCFGVNWYLTMPQYRPADDWTPEKDN
ncbi:MAG: VOC family protein [Lachnospiraceae bacterium]